MGNDAACNVIGIGNVRMRMFDGQVRTLSNVRHVRDMRKNLLSLGALEAQGFKFSGEDGVIKVSRGSMTVLKAERVANLYRMKGSIIAGDASVSTEKEDTTRLWHMRLGYISERGLQLLHMKGALSGIKSCKLELCEFCILGRQRRVSFSTSE